MSSTIYAASTAPGRAAVAVVRISGPASRPAAEALAGALPPPRQAGVRTLRSPAGEPIDRGLVLWFEGPASYTGEDLVEFHVHGGPAVVAALLEALAAQGLRLAEPGEFTRRAFERGKLDLTQAEGVADLIEAETAAQRRQALDQLGGRMSQAQARWREDLIEAQAIFEAAVDFPDEEIPTDVLRRAEAPLRRLIAEVTAALDDVRRGERIREGWRVALVGAPNAGKSTLLNALAGREAAIVTATPGTTRDIIEVPLQLAGYKALVADTAGLRETQDEIEAEGVRRARVWAEGAALRLYLVDGSAAAGDFSNADLLQRGDLLVVTKADLPKGGADAAAEAQASARGLELVRLSAHRTDDVDGLIRRLADRAVADLAGSEPPAATRQRHRELLTEALERLESALANDLAPELAAEDVRLAGRALDRITGRIHPEDVLDRVFAAFCIGK
ncbi:tRNA uridine-5-carboxymethylaminomethyl(34) synthesis GTPase MnmE [Phenylobacterium sp.]|jgi:tRNA modification GTPase|uniref:tRNA uridine-5-carboxymethylaminomethyl(34) synthesis GTPase MnmE n=1 Tax=Phenylobacterium sp. TaxID=1871053 RepID=UPI002E355499|nr:tRNA uridine-5-carboxymethylaminomethyl(34) synthesis GTPase MnmE [Phenylobacterium sp.]HEX2560799.1 tRNA uridine-5-carboxymethylaminomethyl(34) synthesis GTPase MnmE [Phenylobacterium sp.]